MKQGSGSGFKNLVDPDSESGSKGENLHSCNRKLESRKKDWKSFVLPIIIGGHRHPEN
jgi:hypothetical protein